MRFPVVISSSSIAVLTIVIVAVAVGQEASFDSAVGRQSRGGMFGWNMMEGGKRSCAGPNGRPGVCMGQNECTKMNGKSVGRCFPFDSCCSITPNSCGAYSGFSTSYFQSPDEFQETCAYKVNVRRDVCQIRIDFEKFTIGQPTKASNGSAYTCERDEFVVLAHDGTKINVPVLCGENSGQHVYVPVKEQTSSDLNNRHQMTLKFRLTARDEDNTDPEPHWKLKVTQLECPTMSTNWWKIKDIARQIWDKKIEGDSDDDVEEEKDASGSKHPKYTLAPDGCLQYYTDKDGWFESFNYNKGMGHYLGNLNYAVCFKRSSDTCGIKYEAVKFQMAYNRKLFGATDRDCDTADVQSTTTTTTTSTSTTTAIPTTTTTTAIPTTSTTTQANNPDSNDPQSSRMARRKKWPGTASDVHSDYLLIPDGLYSERSFASKYCDQSLEDFDHVTVNTQGPLYVAFVSDGHSNPNKDVERGYKINYSLINTGC